MIAVSPLIENVFAPLDKIVLMPLGVSAAMSETDANVFGNILNGQEVIRAGNGVIRVGQNF